MSPGFYKIIKRAFICLVIYLTNPIYRNTSESSIYDPLRHHTNMTQVLCQKLLISVCYQELKCFLKIFSWSYRSCWYNHGCHLLHLLLPLDEVLCVYDLRTWWKQSIVLGSLNNSLVTNTRHLYSRWIFMDLLSVKLNVIYKNILEEA